ncbi:MAG: hotdog fold thioesterase [Bacteroidia bacterium]
MKPEEVVNVMMEKDYFSQWLGINVIKIKKGYCKLTAKVRKETLNGFGIAHGGFTYSVADSALAFSSNAGGRKSVSIETSISHIISLEENDEITAEAICETETEKLGHYKISVYLSNDPKKIVALFKGMVYKTSKNWD